MLGSACRKGSFDSHQFRVSGKFQGLNAQCLNSDSGIAKALRKRECWDGFNLIKRREVIGLIFGVSSVLSESYVANGAGLPPEEKPRICDDACEKELENVW